MEIVKIFINDIKIIADEIEKNKNNCSSVLKIINGKIEHQKIDNDYYKIIIRNVSNSIQNIVIDCSQNRIRSIAFSGSIDIHPRELIATFGGFREGYSRHDNLYFYFFNENKSNGNYTISFFDPYHKKVNVTEDEDCISNLTLGW